MVRELYTCGKASLVGRRPSLADVLALPVSTLRASLLILQLFTQASCPAHQTLNLEIRVLQVARAIRVFFVRLCGRQFL